jgi:hypothetical protein
VSDRAAGGHSPWAVNGAVMTATTPMEWEEKMEEQVIKLRTGHEWRDDKAFPLTPMEAYRIMRG